MPVVISFTADQTAAIHDITFLAVKHNGVFVRIERPKSRDEDSIWNQWLMTDNVYRSIRISKLYKKNGKTDMTAIVGNVLRMT